MIKGIVFDKDGTLFDFNATWGAWTRQLLMAEAEGEPATFAALAEGLGYDADAGRYLPESIVIASTAGDVVDRIIEIIPGKDRAALLDRFYAATAEVTQVEAVPLIPYFSDLRRRDLTLGIVTNDAEAPARRHLEASGVIADFAFIAGYDSGFGAKPAPGQLLGFCEATRLAADTCLMVGDSTHDLHAGRAAGMMTVGVLTGPAPTEELSPFADVVLSDIGQIPGWLQAQGLI